VTGQFILVLIALSIKFVEVAYTRSTYWRCALAEGVWTAVGRSAAKTRLVAYFSAAVLYRSSRLVQ